MDKIYNRIKNAKRIVVKVGTSTITYETGKINIKRLEEIAKIISDLNNCGKEIILVSSGAVGVAMGKLGLAERPRETRKKQAVAAIGQCELMYLYDKFFSDYNNVVAQILLTKDVVTDERRKINAQNTFNTLLEMDVVPIVNENDSVSTDEIEFGDNDTLSADVATLVGADLLVIFSDIDGMYDKDPHKHEDAKLLTLVTNPSDVEEFAGGVGSNRGTGGMISKVHAAQVATENGVDMVITNGKRLKSLYDILDGKSVGTLFAAQD